MSLREPLKERWFLVFRLQTMAKQGRKRMWSLKGLGCGNWFNHKLFLSSRGEHVKWVSMYNGLSCKECWEVLNFNLMFVG